MKIKSFFTFMVSSLAVLMASCSSSEDPSQEIETGASTTLFVTMDSDFSKDTKAVGTSPTLAVESQIAKGVILIFKGTGTTASLDGKATFNFLNQAPTPVPVKCTAGTNRQVYVVANVDSSLFNKVATVADLYNLPVKDYAVNQTGANLPMSGFVTGVNTTGTSVGSPVTVPVTLNFTYAKVQLDWDVSNLPNNMTGFTVTNAYLLNVKKNTDYFAVTNGYLTDNVNAFLYGRSSVSGFGTGTYFPASTATNDYAISYNLTDLATGKGFNNYFYVPENAAATNPTIVVLEGTLSGTTYYYPIIINGPQNGSGTGNTVNQGDKSSIVGHGNIYYVKAYIQGFGNDNPYNPINTGAINVVITPAVWNPIIYIDQVFN